MKYKISVTKKDILLGKKNNSLCCPIARAMKNFFGDKICVGTFTFRTVTFTNKNYLFLVAIYPQGRKNLLQILMTENQLNHLSFL
jgi:hypothetical protein